MTLETFDLQAFRHSIPEIEQRHEDFLAGINTLNDQLLERLLRIAQVASTRPDEELREGSYLWVFLALASKVISHAESIRAVVQVGRYGDAMMVLRGLIGDLTMLQYISSHPDDCAEICEMSRVREEGWKKRSRFYQLAQKYKESNLRKAIQRAGDNAWSDKIYGIASEAAHPSMFGLKFYHRQIEGTEAEFVFTWGPRFEEVASFRCASTLSALLVDTIDTFFAWNQRSGGHPWLDALETDWIIEREHLHREVSSATQSLITAHKELYPKNESP